MLIHSDGARAELLQNRDGELCPLSCSAFLLVWPELFHRALQNPLGYLQSISRTPWSFQKASHIQCLKRALVSDVLHQAPTFLWSWRKWAAVSMMRRSLCLKVRTWLQPPLQSTLGFHYPPPQCTKGLKYTCMAQRAMQGGMGLPWGIHNHKRTATCWRPKVLWCLK